MSIRSQAFRVLHEDLQLLRPDVTERDAILCPICLREIPRGRVLEGGIEHIIPQVVVKQDAPDLASLGSRNQRAGITVLCREPRTIESTGALLKDGCNGFKGSTYDWLLRRVLDDKPHTSVEFSHRHGVAILIMAYLGAFQSFGYDYVLRPELNEVRRQFDHPDDSVTSWLDHARFELEPPREQVVTTESGLPFLFGGILNPEAPLHVIFRRCEAYLPQGHWTSRGVAPLESLLGMNE